MYVGEFKCVEQLDQWFEQKVLMQNNEVETFFCW